MKTKYILLSALTIAFSAEAKILRSAALYYTPDRQIEANTVISYNSKDRNYGLYQTKTSFGTAGARFEHGISENFSWGSALTYGMGSNEIKTSATINKVDYEGLLDPELYLKSHFETENLRFHANGIFNLKSDVMVLSYDRSPMNFSSGGSSFGLLLGMEAAAGPTLLGLDLRGDIWKDTQEIAEKSSAQIDTLYFREGGKLISVSAFGELNNFKSVKPGIRLRATQVGESKTELQDNQRITGTAVPSYKLPKEDQLSASLYGRIRLPAHFVLNVEVYGMDSYYEALGGSANGPHNKSYGVGSNLGYKF